LVPVLRRPRLVDDVTRLAYDRSLALDDAMRRIRDRFGVYDGILLAGAAINANGLGPTVE
jgi:hypothetical protein